MLLYHRMNWLISIILLKIIGLALSQTHKYGLSTLIIDKNDSSITFNCNSDRISWEPSSDTINIIKLSFIGCPWNQIMHYLSMMKNVKTLKITESANLKLTNESFKDISKLIKLSLRNNGIQEIPDSVFKLLTSLEVLDLGQNEISEINSELFYGIPLKHLNLDGNSLKILSLNVPTLKYLDVSKNKLESITIDNLNKLVNLSLDDNKVIKMINAPFKNTYLESIRFNIGNFTLPEEFLSNLVHLRYVCLEYLNLVEVPENMIWNSSNITELSLASNSLKQLPEKFFRDSKKIRVLNLSKNNIEKINNELLKPLEKLEKLDLSHNLIVQIESGSINLPKLKVLILSHNTINNLRPDYLFSFKNLPVVGTIDLSHNKINHFDQEWSMLKNLTTINLAYNEVEYLGVDDIQLFSSNVEVDLGINPLKVIDLKHLVKFSSAQEKQQNLKPRKIYLSGNEFVCDCRNYEFANFIYRKMPSFVYNELEINEDLECHDSNNKFSNITIDSLTCSWEIFEDFNKTNICSSGCVCTYRPHDNSALMDCSKKQLNLAPEQIISSQNINYTELNLSNNSITILPDYKPLNIRKLNVSHNNLTTINFTKLPKNLEELHLEHNYLEYIIEMDSTNMLTELNHITMGSNLWDCDCVRGKNTFIFIKEYSSKIIDLRSMPSCPLFSNLSQTVDQVCVPISSEKVNQFYGYLLIITVLVIFLVIVIGILIFLIIKRYKNKIALWLYSRGFTWPILEEPLNDDKKYDAFISFSTEDLEFVSEHLVPGLEEGNMPFKLCLHYRDWRVGDFIPNQIACSIEESRRTVIVLSKNYLNSIWARTEFRTAYKLIYSSSALNERRSRIIVILYGDISTEDLDPELKSYLSLNTYIKWGDGWFWEKLRYALPHRPETVVNENTEILIPDKLNPLKLF